MDSQRIAGGAQNMNNKNRDYTWDYVEHQLTKSLACAKKIHMGADKDEVSHLLISLRSRLEGSLNAILKSYEQEFCESEIKEVEDTGHEKTLPAKKTYEFNSRQHAIYYLRKILIKRGIVDSDDEKALVAITNSLANGVTFSDIEFLTKKCNDIDSFYAMINLKIER